MIEKKTKKRFVLLTFSAVILCMLISGCISIDTKTPSPAAYIYAILAKIRIQGRSGNARIAATYPEVQKISKKWSRDASLMSAGFAYTQIQGFPIDAYRPTALLFVLYSTSKDKTLVVWANQVSKQILTYETHGRPEVAKADLTDRQRDTGFFDVAESLALEEILVGNGGLPLQRLDLTSPKVDLVDAIDIAEKKVGDEVKNGAASEGEYNVIGLLLRPRGQSPKWCIGYMIGNPYVDGQFVRLFTIDARSSKVIERRDLFNNPLPYGNAKEIYWWETF